MKIALAFFGQPRYLNDPVIIEQWSRIIRELEGVGHEIESYAYFWKSVSNIRINDDYHEFVKSEEADLTIDDFCKSTNMKRIEFGDCGDLDTHVAQCFNWNNLTKMRVDMEVLDTGRATMGQWYSTERVLNMVSESNINYDYVVRIRPDLLFSKSHLSFYKNIIEAMVGKNPMLGVPQIRIIRGTPIAVDWFTVISGNTVNEFANNLSNDMAAHISALFTEADMPLSIQEGAFYRFLTKRGYDTSPLVDPVLRIYRGIDDKNSHNWKWPNFKVT